MDGWSSFANDKKIADKWRQFLTEVHVDLVAGINSDVYPDSLINMLEPMVNQGIITHEEKQELVNLMPQLSADDNIVLEALGGPSRDPRTFSDASTKALNDFIRSLGLKPDMRKRLEGVLDQWARVNTVNFSPTDPGIGLDTSELPPPGRPEPGTVMPLPPGRVGPPVDDDEEEEEEEITTTGGDDEEEITSITTTGTGDDEEEEEEVTVTDPETTKPDPWHDPFRSRREKALSLPETTAECDAILDAYPKDYIDNLAKNESVRGELRELARSTALLADTTAIASYLLAAGTAGTGIGAPVAAVTAGVGAGATAVGWNMDIYALTMSAMLLQPKEIMLDLISFLPWVGGKVAKVTKKAFPKLFKQGAKMSGKVAAKGVKTAVKKVSQKAGSEALEELMTEALAAKIGEANARAFAKTTISIGEKKVKQKVRELQARLKIDLERETDESDEDYNRRIKRALKEYAKEEQRRLDAGLKKCIRDQERPIFATIAGAIEGLTEFIDFLDDGLEWIMDNVQEYFADDEEEDEDETKKEVTPLQEAQLKRWQTLAGINKRVL